MSHVKTDKLSARTASGTITLGESGETFSLPSGTTLNIASGATISNAGTASGFGGANTPAFFAERSASQFLSSTVLTKVAFDTEVFDTNNAYDPTTNYRFTVPAGEGGKYFICAEGTFLASSQLYWSQLRFYKNGLVVHGQGNESQATSRYRDDISISRVLDLSPGDYIEVYAYMSFTGTGSLDLSGTGSRTVVFFGFKLVE